MREEISKKFYYRSSNPDANMIVGTSMTLAELKSQTPVIDNKENFEAGKAQVQAHN